MDIYDVSFIISTLWVGPFWMAMLLNPKKEKTKKILSGPWFFLGPIILWFIIMCYNPQGLIDHFSSKNNQTQLEEQARIILPLNQYTEVYWTASFQAIVNFIELRDEKTSQWEIQEYAKAMKEQ